MKKTKLNLYVEANEDGAVTQVQSAEAKENDMPSEYARCLLPSFLTIAAALNATQIKVLACMIAGLEKRTGLVHRSQRGIADETGIKPPNVSTAVAALIKTEVVRRTKFKDSDAFVINPFIAVCGGYKRALDLWIDALDDSPYRDHLRAEARSGGGRRVVLSIGALTPAQIAQRNAEAEAKIAARAAKARAQAEKLLKAA